MSKALEIRASEILYHGVYCGFVANRMVCLHTNQYFDEVSQIFLSRGCTVRRLDF